MYLEDETRNGTPLTNMTSATSVTFFIVHKCLRNIDQFSIDMSRLSTNHLPPEVGKVRTKDFVSANDVGVCDGAVFEEI